VNGKFAIISHGWLTSTSYWIELIIENLEKYRGGCIIVMNWKKYSEIINYDRIVKTHFKEVSNVLSRRLMQLESEGVSGDNIFMYGHSLGARLSIDAAITFGPGKVFQIDGLIQKDSKMFFR
jgi:Lipase